MHQNKEEILYIGFNQDQGCFACGTQKGFKVFNSLPYRDQFKREFDGGIGIVEMLFRCNILALVGGGTHPKFKENKVLLWDDYQLKCIGELTFRSEVKAVKLRKDKVVVVLENRVFVYNFADLRLIDGIDTCYNPKGLCALNPESQHAVLATPDQTKGNVHLELYDKGDQKTIMAHQSSLSALALNFQGTLLATASDKGTLIRIWSTQDCTALQEVRRGSDRAEIYSLTIDKNSKWVACSSDKGTIHLFALDQTKTKVELTDETTDPQKQQITPEGGEQRENQSHKLAFMKKIVPYFGEKWSYSTFNINDTKAFCAFGDDGWTLIVVTICGNYYEAEIPKKKGEPCKQKNSFNLLS